MSFHLLCRRSAERLVNTALALRQFKPQNATNVLPRRAQSTLSITPIAAPRAQAPFQASNSQSQHSHSSNAKLPFNWRLPFGVAAGAVTAAVATSLAFANEAPHPPHYHWPHMGYFAAFDAAAIRRGSEVYRQVCSTCHSLEHKSYRELIGVSHTEAQAKKIAESVTVTDGPNEEGEMFERKGKLFDKYPKPYPNAEYAAFINGGAVPPDLSNMILARHDGENYVMSILTGYRDTPAGLELRQGLHYNVYFPGNAISMAKPLNDGQIEYEDKTPATEAQMAKDVVTFLSWCSMPEHDDRKRSGFQSLCLVGLAALLIGYQKKRIWSVIKTQKITYTD